MSMAGAMYRTLSYGLHTSRHVSIGVWTSCYLPIVDVIIFLSGGKHSVPALFCVNFVSLLAV